VFFFSSVYQFNVIENIEVELSKENRSDRLVQINPFISIISINSYNLRYKFYRVLE